MTCIDDVADLIELLLPIQEFAAFGLLEGRDHVVADVSLIAEPVVIVIGHLTVKVKVSAWPVLVTTSRPHIGYVFERRGPPMATFRRLPSGGCLARALGLQFVLAGSSARSKSAAAGSRSREVSTSRGAPGSGPRAPGPWP